MPNTKTYYLKNMLGKSCIRLIELNFSLIKPVSIQHVKIGEVCLSYNENEISEKKIIDQFKSLGFELLQNADCILVEKIKQAAVELIFYSYNSNSLIRNSDYISQKLQLPYDKLSKIFKKQTKTTLEKYIILLKIEKAKEMLSHGEFSVSEISFMLGYSSVHYLSNQFKKTTGITISKFKENPNKYRVSLENLLI
ncbi:MAG: helix-turn-helix transcriptional regulator [Flavobacteriales bacterium]|nr:helix-turn-helix transcriptional regulator [Flavobacteriales bacterium]